MNEGEKMQMLLVFSVLIFGVTAVSSGKNKKAPAAAEPAYLDQLLKEERYEEFSYLMGIDNVELVKPGKERSEHPFFNDILGGNMLLGKEDIDNDEEQDRQAINHERYPGSKWPEDTIPYVISDDFDVNQRRIIQNTINGWNRQISSCLQFAPRVDQKDYILIISGNGCYSYLGRIGGQQPLSLQKNGCVHKTIILHEMMHAVGFHHEHNRSDRDDFVRVRWENIPPSQRSQYEKFNSRDYVIVGKYDYYTMMHIGYYVQGTRKPAFKILEDGIDPEKMGKAEDLTDIDKQKICKLYE